MTEFIPRVADVVTDIRYLEASQENLYQVLLAAEQMAQSIAGLDEGVRDRLLESLGHMEAGALNAGHAKERQEDWDFVAFKENRNAA